MAKEDVVISIDVDPIEAASEMDVRKVQNFM